MKQNSIFFLHLLVWTFGAVSGLYAQEHFSIKATVVDMQSGEPLPGAHIMLQSDLLTGSRTDENGSFKLQVTRSQFTGDSIIVSFMGYQEGIYPIKSLSAGDTIFLSSRTHELEEMVISGEQIIAEEFAVKKMKQIDIYLNPQAKADPLLAVHSLPASTTTDESANISLRGSSPAETGVYFNGVPVYDAVKFSQLDGIGTFSIFNTAIVEKVHVFPGNPPLEYGNTSSGLIAIESSGKIPEARKNSMSLSLANLGAETTRQFSEATGISLFANYQPSAGLIGLNERAFSHLEQFYAGDLGVHLVHHINDSIRLKLFSYFNTEGYRYRFQHASFNGPFQQEKQRNFTIFNYQQRLPQGTLSINNGISFSASNFAYGNTNADLKKQDVYVNTNYRHIGENWSLKTGIVHDGRKQEIDGRFPMYNYALSQEHPAVSYEEIRRVNLYEGYLYSKHEFNSRWIGGLGIRKNLPYQKQDSYLSVQGNLRFSFQENHALKLAAGQYHKYALPNAEMTEKTRYQSKQLSLDYAFENSFMEINSALFWRQTSFGKFSDKIIGTELFANALLASNRLQLQGSFTWIDALRASGEQTYPTRYDLDYFVRTSAKYLAPRNWVLSLIMLAREGVWYRPVTGAVYKEQLQAYQPHYAPYEHMRRYPDYFRLDLSISRMWPLSDKVNLITFLNVSNLLNNKNVRSKTYNAGYTQSTNQHYAKRTVYFGGMLNF